MPWSVAHEDLGRSPSAALTPSRSPPSSVEPGEPRSLASPDRCSSAGLAVDCPPPPPLRGGPGASASLTADDSLLLAGVQCRLETKDLWDKFYELGTEMIITKSGR